VNYSCFYGAAVNPVTPPDLHLALKNIKMGWAL
jgi:hypothetical protein